MTSNIPPGMIQFFDNQRPALPAGGYEIATTQSISFPNQPAQDTSYAHSQIFVVLGARFSLGATDVHAIYPPGNSEGQFDEVLPNIVLTKPSLPWERTIDNGPPQLPYPPWMALLLFRPDELQAVAQGQGNTSTRATLYPIKEMLTPADSKVFRPKLALDPIEQQEIANTPDMQVLGIDMTPQVFMKIVPRLSELPLLAHVRQVNPDDKTFQAANTDGRFAMVIGNRLPAAGQKQIVHLVSLEGFQQYLPGGSQTLSGYTTVRLISLASWIFTSNDDAGNFAALAHGLKPADGSPDSLLLHLPLPAQAQPGSDAAKLVTSAFQSGYVPLNFDPTRLGERTVAWYRGPLVPLIATRVDREPFFSAEAALIYDPRTGMFDISYAIAWQIGRLLALSDRDFAANVLNWRRSKQRTLDCLQERINLHRTYGAALAFPQDMDLITRERLIQPLLLNFWSTALAPLLAGPPPGAPERAADTGPRIPVLDSSGLLKHLDAMPGLLRPEELIELLERGTDPHFNIRRTIRARRGSDEETDQ